MMFPHHVEKKNPWMIGSEGLLRNTVILPEYVSLAPFAKLGFWKTGESSLHHLWNALFSKVVNYFECINSFCFTLLYEVLKRRKYRCKHDGRL